MLKAWHTMFGHSNARSTFCKTWLTSITDLVLSVHTVSKLSMNLPRDQTDAGVLSQVGIDNLKNPLFPSMKMTCIALYAKAVMLIDNL